MSRALDDNINSFYLTNVKNNYTGTDADHRSEILTWLSPLEPLIRHKDLQTRRVDNVGDWLLETDEFRSWCEADGKANPENPALFCYGDPGVGKTYLSSLVIDRLGPAGGWRSDAVAYFYFDFAARQEQTPANMLGSLLKQIVGGSKSIPESIVQAFRNQKKVIGGRKLRVLEIVKMLQTVTSSRRTYICVDALDQCMEEHRSEVLNSLREILEKSDGTKIFLTGRRHVDSQIVESLAGKAATLSIQPNNEDIKGYIRMRLSKDAFLDPMDSDLESEITKIIAERIPKSFLLVSITLDSILQETTVYAGREKLLAMVDGLDMTDAYGTTLNRINQQSGERAKLAMGALMWISHSERPLLLDELLYALTVETGSTEPNTENYPSIEKLLSCCLGLVTLDENASTVRLIHFTLQEYLCARPDLFPSAHSTIAATCLTYLNFRSVKDFSPTSNTHPKSAPFLEYCSLYWGAHARKQTSSEVTSLALELFSEIGNHLSTKILLARVAGMVDRRSSDLPRNGHFVGFTGLHCASLFGITEITTIITEQKHYDLNKTDFLGITPLIWAAASGQEGVVKLLLEQRDVDPNKADKDYGKTALAWAAEHGHDGVVRLFLDHASHNPDGTDGWWGKTPRIVRLIFGRNGRKGVNPDKPDKGGRTPLVWAIYNDHEEVVRLLLRRVDINPNRADKSSQTPLWWAAHNGHEEVVKLLLERARANPKKVHAWGKTPFSRAVANGHEVVVKLLLERGFFDPSKKDKWGQTPLFWAAKYGMEDVVKLLLEREDVVPNLADTHGRTPIWFAADNGHTRIVELLRPWDA